MAPETEKAKPAPGIKSEPAPVTLEGRVKHLELLVAELVQKVAESGHPVTKKL